MIGLGLKDEVELTRKKLTEIDILDNAINANIPNADLSECVLYGHDFTGANLTGVNFTKSSLTECVFDKSVMDKAILDKSLVLDCSFQDISGHGTSFEYLTLQGECDFSDSNLSSLNHNNKDAVITSFKNAQAGYKVKFTNCNLLGVDINNARFPGVNLAGAKLSSNNYGAPPFILKTNLFEANMKNVIMQGMSLGNLTKLELADLSGSDLRGISFAEMTLWGTNFSHCNLSGMDVVLHVIFADAIMHFCDLADADLTQAISLETAKLEGSTYNTNTKWPKGFDPKNHGLILK